MVHEAASRHDVTVTEAEECRPPELHAAHPFVRHCSDVTGHPATTAPFGTDASILRNIAPCVVLGPGDIDVAHKPAEAVRISDLVAAIPVFRALALELAP